MEDSALLVQPQDYSLLTDLYQLTMAACYVGDRIDQRRASFELFVRRLPENFGYLIAMGLAQVLEYLEQFRFTAEQIVALQNTGIFAHAPDRFWEILAEGSFTGDVWAVPEGTAIFAHEPILRIEAPLWQAQIVETYLLNTINYQTLIATKSARIRDTAGDRVKLLEFGTRRAFSPQASLWAARAALAGGLDATSNVLAALQLGQTPSGTMAHALVMALSALEGSEDQAFTAFHRYFPGAALLIDTYDPIAAAQRLAAQVNAGKISLDTIRLDSGDLAALSKEIRSLLPQVSIFASGDLDEYEIARLQAEGADLQGYGLGTKLVTGTPVNGVYKLVEIDSIPVMKASTGKTTYPGRKQVFRRFEAEKWVGDRLGLMTETPKPTEKPLLQRVMKAGERLQSPEALSEIAQRTRHSVMALPETLRHIRQPEGIAPHISPDLQTLTQQTQEKIHSFYTEQNPL
ncbi:MAG: nicotinate phosphoribosyltransferase [Drouetiella hepatica Uher 2000/2452]|jgi:nicotinate phosphoribosyltransferase|uniref:Nicotinate phosphoribosyltransferase n=1 Tax=Drouetiella hepatica Uher 2000/2452 TaxID=904376 RepID=A0A951QBR3_9CYAN|nr:nicotinate phosphoribosyltransferase [Drouetiella hepatica Uher 2000/2452]